MLSDFPVDSLENNQLVVLIFGVKLASCRGHMIRDQEAPNDTLAAFWSSFAAEVEQGP